MTESSLHPDGGSGCESTGDAAVDELLDRLEQDVADLAAAELAARLAALVRLDGPSTGLHAAGVRVERIRRMFQAFDTAYVVALEAGGEPRRHGCPSTTAFLKAQLRLSGGDAKARVTAAHACSERAEFAAGVLPPERPVLAQARAAGALSAEHTAVIIDALDKIPAGAAPEDVQAAEVALVADATMLDPAGVGRCGRRLLDYIDPDGTLRDHQWKQRIRTATLSRNADGTGSLRALLTPEALETWLTVLDPLAKPLPTGPGGADLRTPGQRVHDALFDAGTRLLNSGDLPACGGTPATVVIHVTQEQYAAQVAKDTGPAGLAETGHGALLPVDSAFRMADQAAICTLLTDSRGLPLELGRATRIATPGQTIALAARDRGCTFPGCDRPAAWTQRHHVLPWRLDGHTDVTNVALVCGYHHRTFEEQGWQCVMQGGRPYWIPPSWIDATRTPIRNTYFDRLPGPGP